MLAARLMQSSATPTMTGAQYLRYAVRERRLGAKANTSMRIDRHFCKPAIQQLECTMFDPEGNLYELSSVGAPQEPVSRSTEPPDLCGALCERAGWLRTTNHH